MKTFWARSYKLIARIEPWLWYVFLATFAWQTRVILWQADVQFIEWRSMALYASDILIVALVLCGLIGWLTGGRNRVHVDVGDVVLTLFVVAAVVSVRGADQFAVSLYAWVRLVQCVLLYFYVRYRAVRFDTDAGLLAFVLGALLQSGLALGQYALQHDVGLRWLGETLLSTHMQGVAVFYDLAQVKILRAYGTLPHPNVLAAYLMAGLWALCYLYLRHGTEASRDKRQAVLWGVAGTMMLWALYLTYSRTMIAVGLVVTVAMVMYMVRRVPLVRSRVWHIVIAASVASLVFVGLFWSQVSARARLSGQEEAVRLRVYYAKEALGSGGHRWLSLNWTGIGIGNFTTWLKKNDPGHPAWLYQPAHDLYLLVYSETGIVGVGLFGAWVILVIRSAVRATKRPGVVRWGLVMVVGSFLVIALFDHFFWTLQQGRILFWVTLAVAAAGIPEPHRNSA